MAYDYREAFSVSGKRCVVTGGAQGLSRGMAEALLENGAEVVLMDVQEEKLQGVVQAYRDMGYQVHGIAGDLSRKEEIEMCIRDRGLRESGLRPGFDRGVYGNISGI